MNTKKNKIRKLTLHEQAHEEISRQLHHILNEVSANGNPGLDASLKDLYKGQTDIRKHLHEIHNLVKPDLDRAAFYKQAAHVWKQSWLYRVFDTKLKATISTIILLLLIQVIVHPFIETTLSVAAIVAWVIQLFKALP